MSDVEATNNLSHTADFWDGRKMQILSDAIRPAQQLKADEKEFVQEFVHQTLPKLGRHFDGKALDNLKQATPWLAAFEPGSISDWEKAKSAFIQDGPAFLDILASFTELTCFENLIAIMVSRNIVFSTRLLLAIRKQSNKSRYRGEEPGMIDQRVASRSAELSDKILDTEIAEGITRSRIDALLRNFVIAEACQWSYDNVFLDHVDVLKLIFQSLWETNDNSWIYEDQEGMMYLVHYDHEEAVAARIKKDFCAYFLLVKRDFSDNKKAHVLADYTGRVRSFVHQVGCAKVHDKPEDNIAELRLFHSTTIGYFAKLQDQYLKKELEVKKLRHHISALKFRYLLEHLPDIKLHQDAGPRWTKFWENALKDEADNHWNGTARVPDHALKSIVEKRNPKRGFVHPTTKTKEIHTKGKDGFLYTTGETMYSVLSDEIHRYRGEEYKVEDDDGWTEVVTDVLRALKPLEANIDAETHEVDWAAERLRYTT